MAAVVSFPQSRAVPERETERFRVGLDDDDGLPLAADQVDALYLSLRDKRNDVIVNSRENVQVKNANGGTLTEGLFEMQFTDDDMAAFGAQEFQPRVLTLDFRLVGGGRGTREVRFWVRAMRDIADGGSP